MVKITASTSGGFAGVGQRIELDTACHPDGPDIEALLARLDFFGAQPRAASGADLVRWEITADDGTRCRTVVLHEDAAPDAGWQALIARLRAAGAA